MGQCRAKTKKGDRCRREASENSRYCGTHKPVEEPKTDSSPWDGDLSDSSKTLLGLTIAAVVVFSYLLRGRF